MVNYVLRKIFVLFIFILPVITNPGCKKQARCGCGKDVLFSLTDEPVDYTMLRYNEEGTSASFSIGYSTYIFCNPVEFFDKYKKFARGDQILISGDAYWECNYLYSTSNYSYGTYYKIYQINITDLKVYLYGKK
jgi:hypothetical protein